MLFWMRSKSYMSRINLQRGILTVENRRSREKKRICSEVSVNSPGNPIHPVYRLVSCVLLLLFSLLFSPCVVRCERVAVVQVLRHFIRNVLAEAHTRRLKRVALPAVGTGLLNFPADVVACCMFNECDKFSESHHSQSPTTLSEVRLVVHEKDQSTFDVRLWLLGPVYV